MRRLLVALCLLMLAPAVALAAPEYLGDFPEDHTAVRCHWNTNSAAGASVTRTVNGTVSVYKDANTTQTTVGVTDTEDFDTVTGDHLVTVDTSADAFYVTGTEYAIKLAAATIDGQTVNATLCQFSIERAGGTLALLKARTPNAAAGAAGGLLTRVGPTIEPTTTRVKGATNVILTVPIKSVTGAPLSGLVFNSAGLVEEICRMSQGNAICDAPTLVTATRGTWTSNGFVEKDATNGIYEIHVQNAAFATGADQVKITLSGVANMEPTIIAVDLVDLGLQNIATTLGTPAGASVSADIAAVKTDTAAVKVDTGKLVQKIIREGTAQAGAATTITLDAGANANNDFYNETLVQVVSGTGAGQARVVSTYVGATKVATVSPSWVTNPDNTSVFVIWPFGVVSSGGGGGPTAAEVADAVWDEARAGHTTAGSFGEGIASVQGNVTGNVAGSVGSVTGAVGSVTGNVGGNVTGSVGSLAAQAKTDVNAEVVDALNVDTYAEPGQGAPASTATLAQKLGYLYKSWRNKVTNDGSAIRVFADDGTTVDQKSTVSDSAGTFTRGEYVTGP